MFVGMPALTLMIALSPVGCAGRLSRCPIFQLVPPRLFMSASFSIYLAPKIAGLLDAMLTDGRGCAIWRTRCASTSSAAIELVFSFLQGAVSTIRTSIFMIGLLFGKSIVWSGQRRDAEGLSWRDAAACAVAAACCSALPFIGALALISPTVLIWSLPLTAGYVLAIPFAVIDGKSRAWRAS